MISAREAVVVYLVERGGRDCGCGTFLYENKPFNGQSVTFGLFDFMVGDEKLVASVCRTARRWQDGEMLRHEVEYYDSGLLDEIDRMLRWRHEVFSWWVMFVVFVRLLWFYPRGWVGVYMAELVKYGIILVGLLYFVFLLGWHWGS